jgi:hypothetical protein
MRARFITTSGATAEHLNISQNIVLLHGEIIDERGKHVTNAWPMCQKVLVRYDVNALTVMLDDCSIEADAIDQRLSDYDGKHVVLEATTLGFAELFVLISGFIQRGVDALDVVYVEPSNYTRSASGLDSFSLSERAYGYQPIPRAVVDLGSDDVESGVFFLGFESERLDRALEEHQMISEKDLKVVFGLPAYRPEWELDSVIPHLPRLQFGAISTEYCSANDPEAAFECLERTRSSLGRGKRMFVAPIGTKPCGIATAVFASTHSDQVGLIFDHPKRKPGRSDGAMVWHRYQVEILKK